MGERYLNVLTLRLRAVDGPGHPESVSEAYEASVYVDRPFDHEALFAELERELVARMEPFTVQERVEVGSWGADWSGAVLDVMTVVGGFAGALYVVEKLVGRLRGPEVEEAPSSESAIEEARRFLESCGIVGAELRELEPVEGGYRMVADAAEGSSYIMEVERGGVRRFRTIPPGKQEPAT